MKQPGSLSRPIGMNRYIITALGKEFKVPAAVMDDPWLIINHEVYRSLNYFEIGGSKF
jgi:hypothetical protein